MEKRIIGQNISENGEWLDLEKSAQCELSSEDPYYPIEEALKNDGKGWKAEQTGKQTIRFIFHKPVKVNRIKLLFQEREKERTQQFTLKWFADDEKNYRQIVCQQYNFSPSGSNEEAEDYKVSFENLKILELEIIPDISNNHAYASLKKIQLA